MGGESFAFTLPFVVIGSLLFLTGLVSYFALPKVSNGKKRESSDSRTSSEEIPETSNTDSNVSFGFFSLLKFPVIVAYAFAVVLTSLCAGFLTSKIPHTFTDRLIKELTKIHFSYFRYTRTSFTPGWHLDHFA
jgi:hypothetical protein